MFLEFCELLWQMNPTRIGVLGTSDSQPVGSTGKNLDFGLASEARKVEACGTAWSCLSIVPCCIGSSPVPHSTLELGPGVQTIRFAAGEGESSPGCAGL